MLEITHTLIYLAILIISVTLHEVVHGYVAVEEGDPTPKNAKLLTLNPLTHIDIVGTIIFPLFLLVSHSGFVIGWGKQTPYNSKNFRKEKKGIALVSLSGIIVNGTIAIVAATVLRIAVYKGYTEPWLIFITTAIALINLLLAIFNSLPIPPLDGFKFIFSFFHGNVARAQSIIEYYSVPILIIVLLHVWPSIFPTIDFIFKHVTGMGLSAL